ncbi:CYP3A4 [Bugula neritina]|uniref:CYP3A4 n=1 Tax=Bugula neritina TaxID=10212 RepID=A0A7J7KSX6_BUGNE|nr:CYP3A4 [Bugula neritina]
MEIIAGVLEIPLWAILLTIATVLSYIYLTWRHDTWSKQSIRGPKPLPLFGNFLSLLKHGSFATYDKFILDTYGKISGSFRGRVPILDIADPEYLRLTMIKDFSSMPNRNDLNVGESMLDNFMTALTDDHWRHVRSSLTPTFTSGKLKQMKGRIDVCANTFVEHIREQNGEPFDSKMFTGGYTMDVISSTAFGIQIDSQKDPNHPMLINANKMMNLNSASGLYQKIKSGLRIAYFLLAPTFLQKFLTKFGISILDMEATRYFKDVTGRIFDGRSNETTKQKDFIQLCLNLLVDDPKQGDADAQVDKYGQVWTTKGLKREEIVSNAVLFFLAGYETTATTLNFILYELAMNQGVQQKAYEEIMENMSSEEATYEELSKMEVERLVEKDTSIEGIHLPAGCMVSAMIYAIHHDPEIWPEPEEFRPERFSPENSEGRHQYAWMPFGIGNRNCIGMRLALLEMKIALVKILTNFVLEPCDGTPEKPMKYSQNFRMAPEKPIKIAANCRKG